MWIGNAWRTGGTSVGHLGQNGQVGPKGMTL